MGHIEAMELARRRLAPTGLTGSESEALASHLQSCDDCRRKYEREVLFLRAAAGGEMSSPLGVESRVLMEETLHRLGLAQPAPRQDGLPMWARYVWGTIAAVALLVLVFPPAPPQDHPLNGDHSYLASRGEEDELPEVGLGLSGVDQRGLEYEVVESGNACLEDALRFYVNSRNPDIGYYFLFGLQPEREVLWYFPLPEEGRSYTMERDGDAEGILMVPFEIELEQRHVPGPLTVVGLFSAEPLSHQVVSGRVESWLRHNSGSVNAEDLVDVLAGISGLDVRVATINSEVRPCGEGSR